MGADVEVLDMSPRPFTELAMRRHPRMLLALAILPVAWGSMAHDGEDHAGLHDCEPEAGVAFVLEGEPHDATILGAPLTFPLTDTDGEPAEAKAVAVVAEPYAMNFTEGNKGSVTMTITWDQPSDIDLDVYDADGAIVGTGHTFNIDSQTWVEMATWTPEPCETYTAEILNNIGIAQNITITTEVTSKAPRVR